jgi:hypothetical protein
MHDDFPVSIDLALEFPAMGEMPSTKKSSKKVYPSLYISGAKNLESLPREGYALIHFKRRSVTVGERDDEECCSADLEIHEIRLPEKGDDEEMGDMADALKSMAKERGLMKDESEEEEGDEESESLMPEMEESDEDKEE